MAQRLGVSQPSVIALEQSEAHGAISLKTLRRAAEALDCTLVYALIPNKPLETTVRDRARAFASRRRRFIQHSMLLEDQQVRPNESNVVDVEETIRQTMPSRFWDSTE